jgi:hypothetical protein
VAIINGLLQAIKKRIMNSRRKSHILGFVAACMLANFASYKSTSRSERRNMKTKFGSIIVAGSGKIGGHVASKNRSGSYLRTKVSPINPQSASQTSARNRLSTLATGWKSLTQAQQAQWNSAVQQFKGTNIFGDVVNPSGFNLYCQLNINLARVGVAAISTPPAAVALPAPVLGAIVADNAPQAFTVAFTPTPVGAGFAYMIEATPILSPGRSFVKNDFRYLQMIDAAGASPADILTTFTAKFGSVAPVGGKVFVRLSVISKTTGQKGIPVVGSTIVIA